MRYDLDCRSIPGAIRRAAARWGEAEALVDGEKRWSFAELDRRMTEAVRAARALGVGPGDRVGLCAPNSAEWITAALGILGAGGILVPLNTRFRAAELAYVLRTSDARALFTAPFLGRDYVAELKEAEPELRALGTTVSLRDDAGAADHPWPDFLARAAQVPAAEAEESVGRLGPDDVCDIMFTSGTTGQPKGVQLTHGQSLRTYGWMAEEYTLGPGDTYLVVPPFFHCFGYKAGWLASFLRGVRVIPMPVFEAPRAAELIAKERVSVILGPPTIFQDLLRVPDRDSFDLTSLRVSMTGGTTIPESLIRAMKDELSFETVLSAYGLTEASALVTTGRVGDDVPTVARTSGRAIPGVEVRVADDGEILVRGFTVTRGYWRDPEATRAAIDADGWLHTGDIGALDESGNLSIVDRKKDMFIVGGFNAYPAEIERLLLGCPGVRQAAVIGVPDERLGEAGCAFVVPAPGEPPGEEEIAAWAREHMANFKVPRHVRYVDEFPRNASGKVLKGELRERFAKG